jgi:type I restriction enzyme M protein
MTISDILKDSDYKIDLFSDELKNKLENSIITKEQKNGKAYFISCLVRKKEIKLTPEEIVRQLYIYKLTEEYGYSSDRMQVEYAVHFGREVKRADIVIMDKLQPTVPYIIIEVKKPKLKDGKEQLKSYCNATGATMAVWSNGQEIAYYHRKDPNYFEPIPDIPEAKQSLKDLLKEKFTIDDLIKKDILSTQRRSLKNIILDMEDEVLANAGVDVFEEVFKLVFIKLYDELQNTRKLTKNLEFRNYGESDSELKEKIEGIFAKAKKAWGGVFNNDEKIRLTPPHLAVCVSSLQDVKLFNSNLDVIDDAFEYLVNKTAKGEKGQYFTPRYVIDMAVKMLNPQESEYMIDTASGSCGFPIHTVFYVWKQIYQELGIEESHLFTAEKKHPRALEYVREKVFGVDFDEKSVRVSRMLNIIAGDGHTNVLNLNSLDYDRWDDIAKDEDWQDNYFEGWRRLKKLRTKKDSNKEYEFDLLLANPPFAGDIKESRILSRYELGKNANGKWQTKVGRDILFIERNLDMLKAGGRMAVVLPQGRFNNSSDKHIRDFIAERCRILAVVGLHGNVFKPHTGTKTSVLFVQKWDEKLCPRRDDYPIFFATMQEPSKDNSGDKIYVKNEDGTAKLDMHGHLIVKHDLYNHDGITQDGIAEAFAEFAKKEGLSFYPKR